MKKSKKLCLCVFIDAFGWELAKRHRFLDDVLITKAPVETIFGYSSTCDPTILTGKLPREHGHFVFFYYSPEESPFRLYRPLDLLPKFIMNRGRVRAKFSRIVEKLHGYTGYFQLYNMPFKYLHLFGYSEKRDLYQPGGINGGQPTIFDHLRERKVPYALTTWRQPERVRFASLESEVERGEVAFAYLFLGDLDGVLHGRGTQAPEVAAKLQSYESELRRIVAKARDRYETFHMYVFSDHGMTDITGVCDLMPKIEALGLGFGKDYAAVYDSTMARFWFLNDGARAAIVRTLEAEPQGRIVSEEELKAWGCDFPGQKYGQLFFLMNPGTIICPGHMGEKPLPGMHGYDPSHPTATAAFMSSERVEPLPKRLDDLYGIMRAEVDGA